MKKFLILFFPITFLCASVDFKELVVKVLTTHPTIKMSEESIKYTNEKVSEAKWQFYPTPYFDVSQGPNGTKTTARIEQPVWTFGKLESNLNLAYSRQKETTYELDEEKNKLIELLLKYTQDYYLAKSKKQVLINSLNRMNNFSEMIDRRVLSGVSSNADKKLLESKIIGLKSDLESIKNQENTSLKLINILTGDNITDINIDENFFLKDISIDHLILRIEENDPTLKKISQKIESMGYEIDKQKANFYPSLVLNAEYIKGNLYEDSTTSNDKLIYMKLQTKFGSGLSDFSYLEQLKIEQKKLMYEKEMKLRELESSFLSDYNNLLVSENKVQNQKNNQSIIREVFDSNERLFFANKKQWLDLVSSSKELMDIEISFSDAKITYLINKYKVALKSYSLNLDDISFLKKTSLLEKIK